ncbi:MAG: hypothetical protein ACOVKP_03945 [Flavobacterium sp.]
MKKVLYLVFLSFSASSFAAVSVLEREALLDWYQAKNDTQWNIAAPISIGCGVVPKKNKWIGIDVSEANLSEALPIAKGGLVDLKKLNLLHTTQNVLFSIELANFRALEMRKVSLNQVAEVVPPSIGNLSRWVQIQLYLSKLKETLPFEFGKLTNVELLSLFNNEINGKTLTSLYAIHSLKVELSNNQSRQELRLDIVKLRDLEDVSLFDNELKGLIPKELESLKKLRELNYS